jgi:hypothetical protein
LGKKLEQTAISHAGSPLWKTADIGYMVGSQQELRQKKDRLFKKYASESLGCVPRKSLKREELFANISMK